jgi:Fe-S cluster assembly protein SufD
MPRLSIQPRDSYTRLFARTRDQLPGAGRVWLDHLREDSLARFLTHGFPSQKVEAWKYTSLNRLAREDFAVARPAPLDPDAIAPHLAGGPEARRLVFVNGHLVPELSRLDLPAGLESLDARLARADEGFGRALADGEAERSLSALNAAFLQGGAVIEVADGVRIEEPLQLLFVTVGGDAPQMVHPRNLVRLGAGSRLHLIESHVAQGGGTVFTNLVARFEIGEGAELRHDRLQLGREGTTLIGRTVLDIGARAHVNQTLAQLGGDLTRNETHAILGGPGIELHLNGAFLPRGEEHADNQIWIEHAAPHCESYQFYKGVLDERGHGVFAGKISVREGAQKTNAFQANNNLILSDTASVDTKPELEIFADDVKCSHGATVGELDEHELFYLRSRGLDLETARGVLTYAFAGEVFERFGDDEIRAQVRRELRRWLPGIEALETV